MATFVDLFAELACLVGSFSRRMSMNVRLRTASRRPSPSLSRYWIAALIVAIGIVLGARAEAQQLRLAPVDLQVFRPAMDSKGYITLNSSQVLGRGDFSFGLVSTWG